MKQDMATQFLTFDLDGDVYAIDVLNVQEIRGWSPVRTIPNAPDYVKGALNLRESVVPVIDLKARFNLAPQIYSATTVVIVVRVEQHKLLGIVADAVLDVIEVNPADIKAVADFGARIDVQYMSGMYVAGDEMILLLNTNKMLSAEELDRLETIS